MTPIASELLERARNIGADTAALHADEVDLRGSLPSRGHRRAQEASAARRGSPTRARWPRRRHGPAGGGLRSARAALRVDRDGLRDAPHPGRVHRAPWNRFAAFFARYLVEVVEKQTLIASVTSEATVGGEIRTSVAAVEHRGDRVAITKDATTISYGAHADALLLTARRSPGAPASDQVLVLLRKHDYTLEEAGTWDTLGMRGTCSPAFMRRRRRSRRQILDTPFADIASQTMVPSRTSCGRAAGSASPRRRSLARTSSSASRRGQAWNRATRRACGSPRHRSLAAADADQRPRRR